MALIREIPRSLHSQGTGDVAQRQTELLAQGAATRDPATIPPRLPSAAGPATAARVSARAFPPAARPALCPAVPAAQRVPPPTAPRRLSDRVLFVYSKMVLQPLLCARNAVHGSEEIDG